MSGTIFDAIEEEPSGEEGFFKMIEKSPQIKEDTFFDDIKDYSKTILKGSLEGIGRLGQMVSPLGKNQSQELQNQTQNLDELLPTDEGYTQKSIRRGLQQAPSAVAFPGSKLATLPRSIAAGFLGEGAKELGAPEWAQNALEITAYIGPDITKKLIEKGSNKEIIAAAKKLGISDEALTPLLQSDFKTKWLSKLTPRRGKTQQALNKSKSELHQAYGNLQSSQNATSSLSKPGTQDLMRGFYDRLKNMPANVRNLIKEDFQDLISRPITGESLMNFYADVNHNLGNNTKQLSLLKEPIKNALKKISPELEKDFSLINDLYGKYYKISSKLKPNLTTDIIGASEAVGTLFALTTGNFPYLVKIGGEKAGRAIAQQMLINPRFQQLSHKMITALNENKFTVIRSTIDQFKREVEKISPEFANELEKISDEDLQKMLSRNSKDQKGKTPKLLSQKLV